MDPFSLYGEEIRFSVSRDGEPVGSHIVRFDRDGEDLLVRSNFEIALDFLFFTAYRYRYSSQARWHDGRLLDLEAVTDDNGDVSVVKALEGQGGLEIAGPSGTLASPGPIHPTNHWNAAVIGQTQVLNTITGHINRVAITEQGEVTVATEHGPLEATHYRYSGDLETEVWYDRMGRWVKLRFAASDGSTLVYRCEQCLGPGGDTASK